MDTVLLKLSQGRRSVAGHRVEEYDVRLDGRQVDVEAGERGYRFSQAQRTGMVEREAAVYKGYTYGAPLSKKEDSKAGI
ncbi:MAG: hypothetical protein AAFX41_13510 [Bacteroidota bacterium]